MNVEMVILMLGIAIFLTLAFMLFFLRQLVHSTNGLLEINRRAAHDQGMADERIAQMERDQVVTHNPVKP